MESKGSLPHTQEPSTWLCPEKKRIYATPSHPISSITSPAAEHKRIFGFICLISLHPYLGRPTLLLSVLMHSHTYLGTACIVHP